MTKITTAWELVKILDPTTIESIKNLFCGNQVTFEIFQRTLLTIIPQIYQIPENLQDLSNAIVDLFEELDSDGDGAITWVDFFTYYSQSDFDDNEVKKLPSTRLVFQHIQNNSDPSSGRTGCIVINNFVENGGEFTDTPGNNFHNIHIYNDNYYLVTDTGVYQTDATLSFPKMLFEPSLRNIQGEIQSKKLNESKQKDIREKKACESLQQYGIQGTEVLKDLNVSSKIVNDQEDKTEQKGSRSLAANKHLCSHVVASVLLEPLPYIVVATEYPVMYLIQISGQFGYTDPIALKTECTCFFWDYDSRSLFVGHVNGTVSKFIIEPIKQNNENQIIEQLVKDGTDINALNQILKTKKPDDFTLQDLTQIYPDMKSMLVSEHVTDNDRKKQELYQQKINYLKSLKPSDIHVVELMTQKVFDPSRSTVETHDININQLIKDDPAAFIEANVSWYDARTQAKERKHGGVIISMNVRQVSRKFVAESSIRALVGGRGLWEFEFNQNALRMAVASGEGTVIVIDEQLQVVAAFPCLHDGGILNVHCVGDSIVSVGYNKCYLISNEAVSKAHQGYVVKVAKQGQQPDLDDQSVKNQMTLKTLDNKELFKGDLFAAVNLISEVQPPRPEEPIQFSFSIGNIIGVVDHESNMTMFHAVTGAHLTRQKCQFVRLLSSKFGNSSYNFKNDVGYITLGKFIYTIKAIPNEKVILDTDTWKILKEQQSVLQNEADDSEQQQKKQNKLPLGSISKNVNGILFNEALGELAVITGDLEITFFDYINGKPVRCLDLRSLDKELGNDDEKKQTEYTAIESNDYHQYYVNRSFSTPNRKLPNVLHKIQAVDSILQYLGDKVLSIQLDAKNRVLFLVGDKGIITVYWKTGLPFDFSQVGVVGKQQEMKESIIDNPFNTKMDVIKQQLPIHLRTGNDQTVSGMNVYSLMLDLTKLFNNITTQESLQRSQISLLSKEKKLLFLTDSAKPHAVMIIATSPTIDYMTAPLNSRIHTMIELGENDDINQFDALSHIRKNFYDKLTRNSFILGIEENSLKYDSLRYFLPQSIRDLSPRNKHLPVLNVYSRMADILQSLCGLYDPSPRIVTTMCQSDILGLLAIGYDDGVILIIDTSSTLFARHIIIKQPNSLSIPSVTSIQFMGNYSCIISANSDGYVFVHSIRALKPNGQLLLAFCHTNYHPCRAPRFLVFKTLYERLCRFALFILEPRINQTSDYLRKQEGYDNIIQYIIMKYNQDMIGTCYLEQDNYSLTLQFYLQKAKLYQEQSNTISGTQVGFKQFSKVDCIDRQNLDSNNNYYKTHSGCHSYVQTPSAPKNQEQLNTDIESSIPVSNHITCIGDLYTEEDKLTMMDLTPHFQYIGSQLKKVFSYSKFDGNSKESQVSVSSNQQQQQRQQKITNKIRGAINTISLFKNFVLGMTKTSQQLRIVTNLKTISKPPPKEKPKNVFKMEVKYGEKPIDISEQTKKTIRDLSRSRYIKKDKDVVLQDDEIDDIIPLTLEQRNILTKMVVNDSQQPVQIPVRLQLTEIMRTSCQAQTMAFDEGSNRLLVGDDSGFITSYDLTSLIKQANLQPTKMRTKAIKQPGSEDIIVNAGYEEHQINKVMDSGNGHSIPLFNGCVNVDYSFHAHEMAVTNIQLLVANNTLMSYGEDKRIFCWDRVTGVLQGMIQRVQLDDPAPEWKSMFGVPIQDLPTYPYKQKFHQYQPSPMRIDAPPPAAYPWTFTPGNIVVQAKVFQRSRVICSTAVSTGADDVLKKATDLMQNKRPIPLEKESIEEVFLMSTGTTPERLHKYRNSWTLRAKLLRSTSNRLDIKGMDTSQVLNSFRTRSINLKSVSAIEDMDQGSLSASAVNNFFQERFGEGDKHQK